MNSLVNTVTITPIYAALLGLVLLVLSGRVIVAVRAKGVSLGDGDDPDHLPIIRSQANFIEYVPMILILIGFCEAGGASDGWIHGLGGALLVGRILHPIGFSGESRLQPGRFAGTVTTLLVLLISSGLLLSQQL
ncbi:MAG: MAPEG family protein [Myxococcota bacterium]